MIDLILEFFDSNLIVILLFVVFSSQIGVPLGAMFLIMYTGSSIEDFGYFVLVGFLIVIFTTLADLTAYFIGRKFGDKLKGKYLKKRKIRDVYNRSNEVLEKYGGVTIFFTRFLITGLGPAVNYVCGINKFKITKFAMYIFFGEMLYAFIYLGLGFYFKETWEDVLSIISNFSYVLILLVLLYFGVKKAIVYFRK